MTAFWVIGVLVVLIAVATTGRVGAAVSDLEYDSFNNATNISYDGLNRMLAKNFSSSQYNYSYDAQYLGTLSSVAFPNGSISYSYDDRLRVISEVRIIDGIRFERQTYYDAAGRIVRQDFNPGNSTRMLYDAQGMVETIAGFTNETSHSAFGNVINRTYANSKVSNFTYDAQNARLTRISTDATQDIRYAYDAAGNIIAINDSANNRSLTMGYDFHDRLVNMSINGAQSFIYRYDAIGNLLHVVRDASTTTRLFYGDGPVHAPSRVIEGDKGPVIHSIILLNTTNRTRIAEFFIRNDLNHSTPANWTAGFGDNTSANSTINFSLSQGETTVILIEHNYTGGGNYRLNATTGNLADYNSIDAGFGITISSPEITAKSLADITYQFAINNGFNETVAGVSWSCNNGESSAPFSVAALTNKTIVASHDYAAAGPVTLNCSVSSPEGSGSVELTFTVEGISIENYNRTLVDADTALFTFNITNQYSASAVDWKIQTDGQTFTGTTASIATGSSAIVEQEVDYATPGEKEVVVNATAGNSRADSATDSFVLKSLVIENYNAHNTTNTNIIDFRARNYWSDNLTAYWNLTSPAFNSTELNISAGDSVFVFAESSYPQGASLSTFSLFNNSITSSITERFLTRLLHIISYRAIVKGTGSTFTEAFIEAIDAGNVSWKQSTETSETAGSSPVFLNQSESVVLIIESPFNNTGIANATLSVNSSTHNETRGGIIRT